MTTSIIIPVFGEPSYLVHCLNAIRENTQGEYEVVLVDNGTGMLAEDDGAEWFADVIIVNDQNLGYAKACNQGAKSAHGDILVMLNVDTEPQPGWLPPLIAPLEDEKVGMTGCKLIYPDGRIQHWGIWFRLKNGQLEAWNEHRALPSREVEGTTGACCALRAGSFRGVGGFDESYWNGYDDVDLCLQIRAAGFTIRYVEEAVVIHHESVTGPERWSRVNENVARLQDKWLGHPLVKGVPTVTLV